MATKRTDRKIGRPKKPLPKPKKDVGRPKIPLLEDPERHVIAFYAAKRRVIKMGTVRGRTLGANASATWLAMMRKGDLLKGAAAGDVPGAPDGFVENCPDGFVPVVPLARGKDWPLHSDDVAGPVKTMKKKEAAFWKSDDATKRWFDEAVIIFMHALAAAYQGDASNWILAQAMAEILGDSVIIDLLRRAPGPKLEKFDPFEALGAPSRKFSTS
jgi:hypothetical protein